ncbi:MAG: GumC family protein, partial [Flavobacteriales bacterium]
MQDLEQVLRILKKNWWVLLSLPLLAGIAGYVYAYRLPDVHGARSKVLVKDEKTYDYQKGIRKSVGYYGKYQKIQNQIRVIKSRDLIEKAVRKMDVEVSYYVIGRFRTQEFYDGMPYEVNIEPRKGWIYGTKIYLDVLDRDRYRINYGKGEKRFSHTFHFGDSVSTKHFDLHVKAGGRLRDGDVEKILNSNYYFVRHRPGRMVSLYSSRLRVKNLEYTSILQLSVRDPVPDRAVAFLDTLSSVYIDHTLEQRIKVNRNTQRFIKRQLDTVSRILTKIEDTLETYKTRKGILDLGKEKEEYFKRLVEFDEKKRRLKLRLGSYRSLEDYVSKLNTKKEKLLPSSFYVAQDDDFLRKAVNELYKLQTNRNELMYQNKEKSPKIRRIENEIDEMKKNLLSYIRNSKEAVQDRIKEVEGQIAQ